MTATYTTPEDVAVPISNLRWPFLAAYFGSFIVADAVPTGQTLIIMRQRVTVTVNEQPIPLNDYLRAGGKLEDVK